jgi:hypothetical protein
MCISYGRVQGSGYKACTGKYCIICPGAEKKINTVQNVFGSILIQFKVYTVQNLYGHFLYGSEFIQFKSYPVQNSYS